jgi:hypothetical protein
MLIILCLRRGITWLSRSAHAENSACLLTLHSIRVPRGISSACHFTWTAAYRILCTGLFVFHAHIRPSLRASAPSSCPVSHILLLLFFIDLVAADPVASSLSIAAAFLQVLILLLAGSFA